MKRLLLYCLMLLGQSIILNAKIDNGIYHIKEETGDVRTSLNVIDGQYNLVVNFNRGATEDQPNGELLLSSGTILESDSLVHFVDYNNAIRLEMVRDDKNLRVLNGFSHILGKTFCLWSSISRYDKERFEFLKYVTGDTCSSTANNKDMSVETADSLRMGLYTVYYHMPGRNLRIRSDRTYTLSVDTCVISEGTWLSGFDDLFLIDSNSCIYYHLKIRKEELVPCSNNTRIPRLYLIQEFTRPPKLPKLWPE